MSNTNFQIEKYTSQVYPQREKLMHDLETGQSPHTLVITCADSRILLDEVTQGAPGDFFVIRNAGNIIAPFDPQSSTIEGATLEYAVSVLKVKNVVVLGHRGCGAMNALKNPQSVAELPVLKNQISSLSKHFAGTDLQAMELDQVIVENIKKQMQHIASYPFVKEALRENTLHLEAAVFDFVKGELTTQIPYKDLL